MHPSSSPRRDQQTRPVVTSRASSAPTSTSQSRDSGRESSVHPAPQRDARRYDDRAPAPERRDERAAAPARRDDRGAAPARRDDRPRQDRAPSASSTSDGRGSARRDARPAPARARQDSGVRPAINERPRPAVPAPAGADSSAFAELGLGETLLRGLSDAGYERPTEIQTRAIPPALEGRDVLGAAQTGTGKTAAFVLPILQRLSSELAGQAAREPRALVIAPTRELALQIREGVETYGRHTQLRCTVVYGGVSVGRQADEVARGTDVLVATPGRLVDLMQQGAVDLSKIAYLVLDEVDRMLDQGFWPSIRRILSAIPTRRQTLLFSATMPDALRPLADKLLNDPVKVSVTKVASTPDRIEQRVWHVQLQTDKRPLLTRLLEEEGVTRAIVFTKTKHGANRVAEHLERANINAAAIHGNKSQNARERALAGFRDGHVRVMVATDLAARGIDVDDISHVINYDLPMDPESYVHRIGRTARAGQSGKAFSLCCAEERPLLGRIERLIGRRVPQA